MDQPESGLPTGGSLAAKLGKVAGGLQLTPELTQRAAWCVVHVIEDGRAGSGGARDAWGESIKRASLECGKVM